jgi:hypothetical protein
LFKKGGKKVEDEEDVTEPMNMLKRCRCLSIRVSVMDVDLNLDKETDKF